MAKGTGLKCSFSLQKLSLSRSHSTSWNHLSNHRMFMGISIQILFILQNLIQILLLLWKSLTSFTQMTFSSESCTQCLSMLFGNLLDLPPGFRGFLKLLSSHVFLSYIFYLLQSSTLKHKKYTLGKYFYATFLHSSQDKLFIPIQSFQFAATSQRYWQWHTPPSH